MQGGRGLLPGRRWSDLEERRIGRKPVSYLLPYRAARAYVHRSRFDPSNASTHSMADTTLMDKL
ncbi:MAG: hypothetical protein ABIQ49_10285, partial [Gemmatimonadales bacterium]